jgi:hypothetical protein
VPFTPTPKAGLGYYFIQGLDQLFLSKENSLLLAMTEHAPYM